MFFFLFLKECDISLFFFFFQAEDGIRDVAVTGVQTCALPISGCSRGLLQRSASPKKTRRAFALPYSCARPPPSHLSTAGGPSFDYKITGKSDPTTSASEKPCRAKNSRVGPS